MLTDMILLNYENKEFFFNMTLDNISLKVQFWVNTDSLLHNVINRLACIIIDMNVIS